MKNLVHAKLFKAALVGVAGLLLPAASADAENFHVDITTTALNSPTNSGSAPFSLDFQLNSGDSLNNNRAVINNFTFSGGAPAGSATLISGASGDLSGSVNLADTGAFNEFYQNFTAGGSIGFDVWVSQNTDSGATPDGFHFGIIDGSLFNIPTSGFGDQLLSVDIPGSVSTVQTFVGTGNYAGVTVTVTPIPEPATYGLLTCFAAFAVVGVQRRRPARRA